MSIIPMRIEAQVAVAKVNKYAVAESGDTVEITERPHGGISVVMADGQRSGRSAKAISNIVVRKAISLLAEGVRDGAVARATHDYLHLQRGGKVSAELVIASVDLVSKTLVVSRNTHCPTLLRHQGQFAWLDSATSAVGIYRYTKPAITEFALQPDMTLIAFTDGVWGAGSRVGSKIDLPLLVEHADPNSAYDAQTVANAILAEALRLDQQRPQDDITVLVVKLLAQTQPEQIRRLFMRFPI
ncbi:MAG: PP2C family protein-serine/threonine phosphatase [Caldilineaceae bacterium]